MGIAGISWPQILVILLIVLLVFGTKRIRHIGSDLGGAIREFRKGVGENDDAGSDDEGGSKQGRSGQRAAEDEPGSTREP